eukprot:14370170-Heterocapsa_arctica.AAC.1
MYQMWTHEFHLWHHVTQTNKEDFRNRRRPDGVTEQLRMGNYRRLMNPPEHRFHEHRTKSQFLYELSRWKRALYYFRDWTRLGAWDSTI